MGARAYTVSLIVAGKFSVTQSVTVGARAYTVSLIVAGKFSVIQSVTVGARAYTVSLIVAGKFSVTQSVTVGARAYTVSLIVAGKFSVTQSVTVGTDWLAFLEQSWRSPGKLNSVSEQGLEIAHWHDVPGASPPVSVARRMVSVLLWHLETPSVFVTVFPTMVEILVSCLNRRAQELCETESRWPFGLGCLSLNGPYGFWGRKATLNLLSRTRLCTCEFSCSSQWCSVIGFKFLECGKTGLLREERVPPPPPLNKWSFCGHKIQWKQILKTIIEFSSASLA